MKAFTAMEYYINPFMLLKDVVAWCAENTPASFDQAVGFLEEYEADIATAVEAVGASPDDIKA